MQSQCLWQRHRSSSQNRARHCGAPRPASDRIISRAGHLRLSGERTKPVAAGPRPLRMSFMGGQTDGIRSQQSSSCRLRHARPIEPTYAAARPCSQRRGARRCAGSGRRRDNRQRGHRCSRRRSDGRTGRRHAKARSKAPTESAAASRCGKFAAKPTQRLSPRDGGLSDRPRLHRKLESVSGGNFQGNLS